MKRDLDLVRKILFALEGHDSGFAPSTLEVDGYSEEQVGFHVVIMDEAGLLKGSETTPWDAVSPQGTAQRITWEGYEFLDAARSDKIWEKAKKKIGSAVVGMSFAVLKACLLDMINRKLGLE